MIVNLKDNLYDDIKQDYIEAILPKLRQKIKNQGDINSSNSSYFELILPLLEELLVGEIVGNTNCELIEDYRKSQILANYNIESGPIQIIWKYMNKESKGISNNDRETHFYQKTRKELVEQYNNQYIKEIIDRHPRYYESIKKFENMQKEIENRSNNFNQFCKEFFNYKLINADLRTKVLSSTQANVCPYCNRQFINTYKTREGGKKTSAQLDHFFPKKTFPLFALSLYNFVPSCAHCNTILKREAIFEFAYPINNKSNLDPFFDISSDNIRQAMGFQTPEIKLVKPRNNEFDTLCLSYMYEKLCIESIYETHGEFVKMLQMRRNLYNSRYTEEISKLFDDTDIDFKYLLYGYDGTEEELLLKPLSKLAHDIMRT